MKNFEEYYEQQTNESVTPGNLYRDMNQQFTQLLQTVCDKYQITNEEASQVIADYFTSKQWNVTA